MSRLEHLEQKVYFKINEVTYGEEFEPIVASIGRKLQDDAKLKLTILGLTDNTGPYLVNKIFAKERAESIKKRLVGKYGIKPNRISAFGRGPSLGRNLTSEAQHLNRRAEFTLTGPSTGEPRISLRLYDFPPYEDFRVKLDRVAKLLRSKRQMGVQIHAPENNIFNDVLLGAKMRNLKGPNRS